MNESSVKVQPIEMEDQIEFEGRKETGPAFVANVSLTGGGFPLCGNVSGVLSLS